MIIRPIAHIENDFPEKFGLPRQSGLAPHLISRIIMEPEYRTPEAFRGIEEYDRLWILWQFDDDGKPFSATVRPPKLGGNERVGVFATRSPNRPNHIGMTCVKLLEYQKVTPRGPVLTVGGADLRSGTAVYDIKPYIPYADSYPDARAGFAKGRQEKTLSVLFETDSPPGMTASQKIALEEILSLDPRPGYQNDPDRIYRMSYGEYTVSFRVTPDDDSRPSVIVLSIVSGE